MHWVNVDRVCVCALARSRLFVDLYEVFFIADCATGACVSDEQSIQTLIKRISTKA